MPRPHRSAPRAVVVVWLVLALVGAMPVPVTARPALAPPAAPESMAEVVRRERCPASRFTCVTLRVPRDHFAPPGGPTFDVTFALLRAERSPRKGVWVTITGGPGISGIASADVYTDAFDPAIPEQYDIVFIDQRGVGASVPLQCPDATVTWYTSPAAPTVSAEQAQAFADDARAFAEDCVAETGADPSVLPYFSTLQAVEDLEVIRRWLKADTLDLYGESYGTQFAQTYAAAHPARVRSLWLDGPVDLTLDVFDYYAESTADADRTLTFTLDACTARRACRSQVVGGDALAAYDRLAADLRASPRAFDFVKADGSLERRTFTFGDLESAAAGYIYGNFDRMLLQRALAQASRGDLAPMARLTYISLGQDPETLGAIEDSGYSDAMYYAVECMDYGFGSGSAAARADQYLAAGLAAGVASRRLGSLFYGDLPCAYWPTHPADGSRPPYLTDTGYPVFVLASTRDPATPFGGGVRIFQQLENGYLIVQPGGPHVLFGRGVACADDPVTAFLVRGRLPQERRTVCGGAGPEAYVPVPPASAADYDRAMPAMRDADDEINYSADYWNWDGVGTLRLGCLGGGMMEYSGYAHGYRALLHGCAFSRGLPLTGEALINDDAGTFRLTVTAPGGTSLIYRRSFDRGRSLVGTFRGVPVSGGELPDTAMTGG